MKLRKIQITLLYTVISFCFLSCSKDDDSISGTTWEGNALSGLISLQFTSKAQCRLVETSTTTKTTLYSYEYVNPNVTMTPLNESPFLTTLKCVIKGNSLQVVNPTITSGDKVIYTLTKQ